MFMSVSQLKPGLKQNLLAEAKLLKIKDNTKLMLEGKKSAQLVEELKLKIVEESKAMKEEIRKADHQFNSNKTALKSVQANIKKIKQEADVVPTRFQSEH